MKNKPLIAVIVPIFNAELYLQKCLDSLLHQSLHDIEIILINDGSTDASGEICKEYAAKDDRIVYKKIPNGGVSNARNLGMKLAQADWITFVDADDWVTPDYCEVLASHIKEDVGLIVGRTLSVVNGTVYDDSFRGENCTLFKTKEEKVILYRSIINDSHRARKYPHLATCSAKLFRKSILEKNGIQYKTSLKYYEDAIFNIEVILNSAAVAVISNILYYYRENHESSTHTFDSNTVQYYENAAGELSDIICAQKLPIEDDYDEFNIKNMDTFLTNYFKIKRSWWEQYSFVKKVCNKKVFKDSIRQVNWRHLPSKRRMIIALAGKIRMYMLIQFVYRVKKPKFLKK